jgi:hypothetical protein
MIIVVECGLERVASLALLMTLGRRLRSVM